MPKMVYACDYCGRAFSTRDEAVDHEQIHYKPCANSSCTNQIFIKDVEKGTQKKYCCARCGNAVKQKEFRLRQSIGRMLN